MLVMLAIGLTVADLAVANVVAPAAGALTFRATSAFGLFSAGLGATPPIAAERSRSR